MTTIPMVGIKRVKDEVEGWQWVKTGRKTTL